MSRLTAVLIVAALAGCVSPAGRPAPALDAEALLGADRSKAFELYASGLKEAHHFTDAAFARLGTSWERELERPRARFRDARSKEDVYYALLSLVNSTRDGHTWLSAPAELVPGKALRTLPLEFAPIREEGEWRFVVLGSSQPGVAAGDRLLRFDGKTAPRLMDEYREWLSGSSPEFLALRTARWLSARDALRQPAPREGETARLELLRDGAAAPVGAVLTWRTGTPSDPEACGEHPDYRGLTPVLRGMNYCVYDFPGGTSVVRYASFDYGRPGLTGGSRDERLAADQLELIRGLRERKPKNILIDLRENTGGSLGYALIAAFARKPFKTTRSQLIVRPRLRAQRDLLKGAIWSAPHLRLFEEELSSDPALERSRLHPFSCRTDRCGIEESVVEPTGELAGVTPWILTGPACVSSCDQVVSILKENGIAKLVGLPSRGSSSPFRIKPAFTLANGTTFSMTLAASVDHGPDGLPLEARPAPLDERVEPTRANFRDYLSAALRRAGL